MRVAALVAPFFQDNTLRYLRALCALPVRAVVISQDPVDKLPADIRARLAGHYRVGDCLDGAQLGRACQAIGRELGPVERLLGVLEQLQLPLGQARDMASIPGMTLATARNFRDKALMKDVLRQAGIPVARHRRVECEADVRALLDEAGFPIILKPIDGLGSRGTYRIRNEEELRNALAALHPSVGQPLQAEEFVQGTEHTCETVTIGGQPVWHSGTRYLPGPLEVLENPWIQYCVLLPREEDDSDFSHFKGINTSALSALGMDTGLSHMEWFRRRDGSQVVSEVGARPPGVHIMPLMSLANDVDMIAKWTKLMVFDQFEPTQRKSTAGAAFFRGQGKGRRVRKVHGLQEAQEAVGHLVVDRQLPRVGQGAAPSYEGEGYAILKAPTTAEVADGLKKLVSLVRVELG